MVSEAWSSRLQRVIRNDHGRLPISPMASNVARLNHRFTSIVCQAASEEESWACQASRSWTDLRVKMGVRARIRAGLKTGFYDHISYGPSKPDGDSYQYLPLQ